MYNTIVHLLFIASAASAYEMAFAERLDPDIDNFNPDNMIWNRYNPGGGCTAIPPNPSDYVEEVIVRVPPDDTNPPELMAFFDNGASPGSPGHSPCNVADIVFIAHWYELPDSQQMYYTINGRITHFSEVRYGTQLARFVENLEGAYGVLHEGDVLVRRYFDAMQEWEMLRDDLEFSIPYIPLGSEEAEYNSGSQSLASMEAGSMGEPGAPRRLHSESIGPLRINNQPMLESINEEVEIERARSDNLDSQGDSELDPFEEMYLFERTYPNAWVYLVQQLAELRDDVIATGSYVPIPQGLRNRYTNEELEALGLAIDRGREAESLRALAASREENPAMYQSMIPLVYQIFTGENRGIWNQALADIPAARNQNAEISEINHSVAESRLSAPQSADYESNILGNGRYARSDSGVPGSEGSGRPRQASMELEDEIPARALQAENSNLDVEAECLINDICLEDNL
ncbi:hypothetical protein TWF718_010474 [Orbilia javanica]|uniref:Uncharacterized protein n=1 Tax=Orbilia javanica TaxID=47235 RepID=A0AAN8MM16_9PEZI